MNSVSKEIFNNLQEFQDYLISKGFCGLKFSDFNCIFLLYGDVGQGKTTFVRNFVNSLEDYQSEDFLSEDYQSEDFQSEDFQSGDLKSINVTSPTFNIVHEYKFNKSKDYQSKDYQSKDYQSKDYQSKDYQSISIFHFDLYRIDPTIEKLQEIGLFSALDSNFTFIEWSEKLPESFVNSFFSNSITFKKICLKLLINKSTIEIIV